MRCDICDNFDMSTKERMVEDLQISKMVAVATIIFSSQVARWSSRTLDTIVHSLTSLRRITVAFAVHASFSGMIQWKVASDRDVRSLS